MTDESAYALASDFLFKKCNLTGCTLLTLVSEIFFWMFLPSETIIPSLVAAAIDVSKTAISVIIFWDLNWIVGFLAIRLSCLNTLKLSAVYTTFSSSTSIATIGLS